VAAWTKRGVLLGAPTEQPWAHSHAALPTTEPVGGDQFRLYYSPRDERGRAHVARATVRAGAGGLEVVAVEPDPVLSPGRMGAFDESGVTVSCVVADGSRTLLYYTGWTLGRTVPFYFYAGVAISEDGGVSFARPSEAPILERSAVDPFLTASPCVLLDGNRWRMWYVSCVEWIPGSGPARHRYHVRYAESADGIEWNRDGHVAIDFADAGEYAIARPCVRREADGYSMWFSARGAAYRLCYAESADGMRWHRRPAPDELAPGPGGWDAEMAAYPWIVQAGGARHLLYNGNGYGLTGIGYATQTGTTR
jgi:hypothetical protein